MQYTYKTNGTCSREIVFEIEDGKIHNLYFIGGCNGNLQGIAQLAKGRPVNEIIELLKGIKCGSKASSCPEQLALGLEQILAAENG